MIQIDRPGVFLDLADCAYIDPHLVAALRLGWGSPGDPPPPHAFLQLVDLVHRGAEQYRASVQATPSPGTDVVPVPTDTATLAEDTVWISSRKAAQIADVDESYVRRLLRQGALAGVRPGCGAWKVDAAALRGWMEHRPARVKEGTQRWPVSRRPSSRSSRPSA